MTLSPQFSGGGGTQTPSVQTSGSWQASASQAAPSVLGGQSGPWWSRFSASMVGLDGRPRWSARWFTSCLGAVVVASVVVLVAASVVEPFPSVVAGLNAAAADREGEEQRRDEGESVVGGGGGGGGGRVCVRRSVFV